jgi:hypothetical protein
MCYGVWGMDAHLAGNGLGSSQIVCDIRGYVLSEVLVIRVTTVFPFIRQYEIKTIVSG